MNSTNKNMIFANKLKKELYISPNLDFDFFNGLVNDSKKLMEFFIELVVKKDKIKCPICDQKNVDVFGIDKNYMSSIMMNCENKHSFAIMDVEHFLYECYLDKKKGSDIIES